MIVSLRPPARIADLAHKLASAIPARRAEPMPAAPLTRRDFAQVFADEQAWAGGAVMTPVALRRRFVDACYAKKSTRDQARQRARFVIAAWAHMSRQVPPPWAERALRAGSGDSAEPKPGSRTVRAALIAKGKAKRAANEARWKAEADAAALEAKSGAADASPAGAST